MGRIVDQTKPLLEKEGIVYFEYEGGITVPLPNSFGDLEIDDLKAGKVIRKYIEDDRKSVLGLHERLWRAVGENKAKLTNLLLVLLFPCYPPPGHRRVA